MTKINIENILATINDTILESENEETIIFRSTLTTETEWKRWLSQFSDISNTNCNVRQTYPHAMRYSFRKVYKCSRDKYRIGSKQSGLDTNFPATLDVKIKVITRGSKKNDSMVLTHPCIIKLQHQHNHALNNATNLGSFKVSDNTAQQFEDYFDQGYSATQASRAHQQQLLQSEGFEAVANAAINQKLRAVAYMFDKWRASNFEAYSGDGLFEALKKFSDQSKSNIKWRRFGADNFVIGIVTPLMERIHRNIGEAAKLFSSIQRRISMPQTPHSLYCCVTIMWERCLRGQL